MRPDEPGAPRHDVVRGARRRGGRGGRGHEAVAGPQQPPLDAVQALRARQWPGPDGRALGARPQRGERAPEPGPRARGAARLPPPLQVPRGAAEAVARERREARARLQVHPFIRRPRKPQHGPKEASEERRRRCAAAGVKVAERGEGGREVAAVQEPDGLGGARAAAREVRAEGDQALHEALGVAAPGQLRDGDVQHRGERAARPRQIVRGEGGRGVPQRGRNCGQRGRADLQEHTAAAAEVGLGGVQQLRHIGLGIAEVLQGVVLGPQVGSHGRGMRPDQDQEAGVGGRGLPVAAGENGHRHASQMERLQRCSRKLRGERM